MRELLFSFMIINIYFGFSYQGNAPKLKPFAFDKNVISGQRVRVFCQLLEGSIPLVFQWKKDGHELKVESLGVVLEIHEYYSSLTIDPVFVDNSGNYSCLAYNNYGSDTYSSFLVVEAANNVVVQQQVPPYLHPSVIIPLSVAVVIIVIACSVAYVYIEIEERNAQILKAGMMSVSPSKNFQYISTTTNGRECVISEEGILSFKYSEDSSDKTKPLLARPPIPTVLWAQHQEPILEESDEYATLPFQKFTSFKSPPESQPPPLPPENRRYIYDEKNLICHTPPHTSSSNVFCKVDVHNQDSSDSYDDFLKPQHV